MEHLAIKLDSVCAQTYISLKYFKVHRLPNY